MTSKSTLKPGGKSDPRKIKVKKNKYKENLMKLKQKIIESPKQQSLLFLKTNKPLAIKN